MSSDRRLIVSFDMMIRAWHLGLIRPFESSYCYRKMYIFGISELKFDFFKMKLELNKNGQFKYMFYNVCINKRKIIHDFALDYIQ